ncbi:MAG: mechanosensitive ion channel domain-containing protein [Candidatus Nitrosoglobus sp.]|jgi:small conductance mechanosensitive channel
MENWHILLLLTITLAIGNSHAKEPMVPQNGTTKEFASPEITAVEPNPVIGAQQRQWIKILGSNFTPASKVTLRLEDQAFPIPPKRTKFVSDKELNIYANVSMGPSAWTVQVTNQKGKSTSKFSFNVSPPDPDSTAQNQQNKQKLEEQERKTEVAALDKKAEETSGKITQAKKTAEESKQEAEKAANEKAAAQKEVEKEEQEANALKMQVEAAKAAAQATGDKAAKERAQKLAKEAEKLEKAAIEGRKRLAAVEAKEEAAKKRAAANEAEIDKLRKEFSELRKQRAEKRTFVEKLISVAWIILVSLIVWFLKRLAVRKFESSAVEEGEVQEGSSRLRTLVLLLNWLGTILIIITALYLILDEFGINMAPVLASLGIVGLALSFGGQYLIRDIINGIFILVEGQYNINDVIQVGDLSGFVESVNLRRTQLRDVQGRAIYIPNGEIKTVINFTKGYGRMVVDIGVPFKENIDHVMEVMEEVMKEMRQIPKYERLIKNFEMFGVESLKKSEIIIRCRFKTTASKQWIVAREYRRRLKSRFDELGIEIS